MAVTGGQGKAILSRIEDADRASMLRPAEDRLGSAKSV
jgi:hypothetical protein